MQESTSRAGIRWRFWQRCLGLFAAKAALLLVYFAVARPWLMKWGASDAETLAALPGDELVPAARSGETRAISVHAPAERVFAWVAQLGQDRAGFYSYDVLENLVGCEMPRVQQLIPALQRWQPGDKLWMYPPRKANGAGGAPLALLVPGRAIGFGTRQIGGSPAGPPDASWTFVVQPLDEQSSRLLVRGRGAGGVSLLGAAVDLGAFEPVHFVMEKRMLENIRALAEGERPSRAAELVQVLCWTIAFSTLIASGLLALFGRQSRRRLLVFFCAGLSFQVLTLLQPSPLLEVPLLIGLLLGAWLPSKYLTRLRRSSRAAGSLPMVHAP